MKHLLTLLLLTIPGIALGQATRQDCLNAVESWSIANTLTVNDGAFALSLQVQAANSHQDAEADRDLCYSIGASGEDIQAGLDALDNGDLQFCDGDNHYSTGQQYHADSSYSAQWAQTFFQLQMYDDCITAFSAALTSLDLASEEYTTAEGYYIDADDDYEAASTVFLDWIAENN